ncbi:uncharacterized protein METZ01_LOCUS412281, partial [marine metagenome]
MQQIAVRQSGIKQAIGASWIPLGAAAAPT